MDTAIDICVQRTFATNETVDLLDCALSKVQFTELLKLAVKNVAFISPNGVAYRQKDGVAMGSHLGPALANLFLSELLDPVAKRLSQKFYRYVDDTLLLAKTSSVSEICDVLNGIHPNIRVTCELPSGGKLPFLDIEISNKTTTVYHKPSSTDVVANFYSTCPWSYKKAGISSAVKRATETCSNRAALNAEMQRIRDVYSRNQWPSALLEKIIERAIAECGSQQPSQREPEAEVRCLVLPYLGAESDGLRRRLANITKSRTVFTTPKLRSVCNNRYRESRDDLASNVVYELTCTSCSRRYVGHTGQQLTRRLAQHRTDSNSAINTHGCDQPNVTHRIIYRHVQHHIAEAIFIRELKPALNRKDEKIFTLLLS